jgi:DNA-binding response OmpR family regulator
MTINRLNVRDFPDRESGNVLIVDDEPHLVDMYATMLEDTHTVETATSGDAALISLSEELDVVLLDRRMPDISGDEVLRHIRQEDYGCRVTMVTSVEPDVDILELDFDAYLVKPVRQQDLCDLIERLLLRAQYSTSVQEMLKITSKLATLESEYAEEELAGNEEYQALRARKETLEARNQARIAELIDRGDSRLVFQDVLGAMSATHR